MFLFNPPPLPRPRARSFTNSFSTPSTTSYSWTSCSRHSSWKRPRPRSHLHPPLPHHPPPPTPARPPSPPTGETPPPPRPLHPLTRPLPAPAEAEVLEAGEVVRGTSRPTCRRCWWSTSRSCTRFSSSRDSWPWPPYSSKDPSQRPPPPWATKVGDLSVQSLDTCCSDILCVCLCHWLWHSVCVSVSLTLTFCVCVCVTDSDILCVFLCYFSDILSLCVCVTDWARIASRKSFVNLTCRIFAASFTTVQET